MLVLILWAGSAGTFSNIFWYYLSEFPEIDEMLAYLLMQQQLLHFYDRNHSEIDLGIGSALHKKMISHFKVGAFNITSDYSICFSFCHCSVPFTFG